MCLVRVAAIIYLRLSKNKDSDLPLLHMSFLEAISPSLNETVDDDDTELFSESDLIDCVEQAIVDFEKVQVFAIPIIASAKRISRISTTSLRSNSTIS